MKAMKKTCSIISIFAVTLTLSNCALLELPFKAVGTVLDTTSSVIKSTTGAASNAATKAAPFFLEHTDEGATTEESLQEFQGSPELEASEVQKVQELAHPLIIDEQALIYVSN